MVQREKEKEEKIVGRKENNCCNVEIELFSYGRSCVWEEKYMFDGEKKQL